MNIFSWLTGSPQQDNRKNFIEFKANGNNVSINFHCGESDEEISRFAYMIFLINNAGLYNDVVTKLRLNTDPAKMGKISNIILNYTNQMQEELSDDEDVISPLDVFGDNKHV